MLAQLDDGPLLMSECLLFLVGVVKDILLVPVGISYDVLVERNFVRHELMVRRAWHIIGVVSGCDDFLPVMSLQGGSKRPETFGKVLRGVWAMLTRNAGSIKIDFAQPFSLQVSWKISTVNSL